MFNLQVTLSDFQCRKPQCQLNEEFIVVFRFASIKLEIKILSTYGQFIGGKRIVLDISPQQIEQMFQTYALGMFFQNKSGKFFSLLSLQSLHYSDIISGEEVYFYNDNQEIVYSANFSIVFNDFKNPRLPNNKQAIQNYKTFDDMFKKPAVPGAIANGQAGKTTMSSFLYGNGNKQRQNEQKVKQSRPVSGKPKKSTSMKGNNNKNMAKTSTQQFHKQNQIAAMNNPAPQFAQTSFPQQNINIYSPFEQQDFQETDANPPMMQFTNTVTDSIKGRGLLKTQLQQLSTSQGAKFMTAFQSKNLASKQINAKINNRNEDAQNTRIKIQQDYMMKTIKTKIINASKNVQGSDLRGSSKQLSAMNVDRQQLRSKAKQQLSTYQGNNNIKIPILKDGKYQFVQLSQLSEQEIKKFAQKQKQLQFQQEMKKQMQRQLLKKQKQNQKLRKDLQEKERQMRKKQQQAKKQKEELLRKHQQQQLLMKNNQQKQKQQQSDEQMSQNQQNNYDESQQNYDDSQFDQSSPQQQKNNSPKYQSSNDQQENYYESDFESVPSIHKQSKASLNSSQKLKGEESYNESYDPDFESYSQSFLDSKLKLSASEISQNNHYQYKRK